MIRELLICFIAILVAFEYYRRKMRSGKYPPGPMGIPILGYLPFLGSNTFLGMGKLTKQYGDIYSMSFGPLRCVVLNSISLIREASKRTEFSGRPSFHMAKMWSSRGSNDHAYGLLFNEGEEWKEQRRFTLRMLRDYGFGKKSMENLIQDEIHELLDILRTKKEGQLVSPEHLFEISVVNSLWTIISGVRYSPDDPRLKTLVERLSRDFVTVGAQGMPFYFPTISKWFPNFSGYNKLSRAIEGIAELVKSEISNHKKDYSPSGLRDFMDAYLKEIEDTKNPNSSFYQETGELSLITTLIDLFGGGTETTTTALTWACLYLAAFPEVQKKIHKEMDDVLGRNHLPQLADKERLPYFEAYTQETFRLSGLAPVLVFHKTIEDTEFQGYEIPKDTTVIMNAWYVMHDPKNWERPNEFYPEHFLAPDGSFRNRDAFILFGTGKRVCPAETLARTSFFLFLTSILQEFTLEFPPGEKPSLDFASPGFTLRPHHYNVKFCKRSSSS